MKIIYNVYAGDEYEAEGMFDENGILLDAWVLNDASWRGEYFDGFMAKCGVVVKSKKATEKDIELIKKHFGW